MCVWGEKPREMKPPRMWYFIHSIICVKKVLPTLKCMCILVSFSQCIFCTFYLFSFFCFAPLSEGFGIWKYDFSLPPYRLFFFFFLLPCIHLRNCGYWFASVGYPSYIFWNDHFFLWLGKISIINEEMEEFVIFKWNAADVEFTFRAE